MGNKRYVKSQDGVVIGNVENKENPRNPISRMLIRRFDETLMRFIIAASPTSLHEVGCGEGRLTRKIARRFGVPIIASDLAKELIDDNQSYRLENVRFVQKSIYDLVPPDDRADLMLCCEVLEHLENPRNAVDALKRLGARCYIFSVPREPMWRILNVCRGKYLTDLGNTPGHLNHWSREGFLRFLMSSGFRVECEASPWPWTIVLGKFDVL